MRMESCLTDWMEAMTFVLSPGNAIDSQGCSLTRLCPLR